MYLEIQSSNWQNKEIETNTDLEITLKQNAHKTLNALHTERRATDAICMRNMSEKHTEDMSESHPAYKKIGAVCVCVCRGQNTKIVKMRFTHMGGGSGKRKESNKISELGRKPKWQKNHLGEKFI